MKTTLQLRAILLMLGMVVMMSSCTHTTSDISEYTVEVYKPQYATGFRILGTCDSHSIVIESYTPWQGSDSVVTRVFVGRDDETVPEGFEGAVLNGEASRIVAMSSTQIAMLDVLGEVGRVVGVSGIDFISNPAIQAGRDTIGDVGFDGNIDYELLLSLDPDLVLLYGVNGPCAMENKLKELDIPFMYVGEYLEETPLGKVEWLMPIAEIVGRSAEAKKYIDDTADRYNSLSNRVKTQESEEIKVMLNTPYGDVWFMPPRANYLVALIRDAGGTYIYDQNDTHGSLPIDLEEAYLLTSEATVWLNPGQSRSLDEIRRDLPKFADTRPMVSGRVYNNNKRSTPSGGNDFFETGAMQPDVILEDLIKIFHPELTVDSPLVYYQQLR